MLINRDNYLLVFLIESNRAKSPYKGSLMLFLDEHIKHVQHRHVCNVVRTSFSH